MEMKDILEELDKEIAKLKQARLLLSGGELSVVSVSRGTVKKTANGRATGSGRGLGLSEDGRKRIAEAMKKRWAERKRQLSKASK